MKYDDFIGLNISKEQKQLLFDVAHRMRCNLSELVRGFIPSEDVLQKAANLQPGQRVELEYSGEFYIQDAEK